VRHAEREAGNATARVHRAVWWRGGDGPLAARAQQAAKLPTIEQFGGPEILQYGNLPDPVATPGEVVIDVVAAR
jgi:hypothetical protein